MTAKSEMPKASHLEWLVRSRERNQAAALKVFKLFEDHSKSIKHFDNAALAEALVAISFSLWRAAFLADKSGAKGKSLDDAGVFLGKMLHDNAINYPQDRASHEWTFNYYVSNAHFRFPILTKHAKWPDFLNDKPKFQTPKERWEYYQTKLEKAVELFEKRLNA